MLIVECLTLILILKYYTEYLFTNAYLSDKLFWRDFWRPKMLKNPNFPLFRPGPNWGSLLGELALLS